MFFFGGGGGSGGQVWGGQVRCERRSEVFVKIKKNKKKIGWGGGGVGGVRLVGRFRVDVNAILGVGHDVGYG